MRAWIGHRIISVAVKLAARDIFSNTAPLFEKEQDARFQASIAVPASALPKQRKSQTELPSTASRL
jgi:hypothetical protein